MGIYQNLANNDQEMSMIKGMLNSITNIQHGVSVEAGWWEGVDANDPNICASKMCQIGRASCRERV